MRRYHSTRSLPQQLTLCKDSPFVKNRMFDPEHVSSLIGDIYDAVVDQTLWTGALDKAAQFVGAQAGVLLWQNPASMSVELVHVFGIEPRYVDLYVERYAKLDPTTTPMFRLVASVMAAQAIGSR